MRIHLVAIGGSVMHNLALDLVASGHAVTGSDDEIYEPSRTRLSDAGLLPSYQGWNPDVIDQELDCVIAGMHARADNPEIRKALEVGIKVYSFPEFFGERCQDKKRIVIAGSHGKTTTTAMILHVLKGLNYDFDYLVGASLEGFERNVKLSDAGLCVIEGDEYLSSPLDLRPKFMHYNPNIAIITGIAWDHMNVFPTWEIYVDTFRKFIAGLKSNTRLIWYGRDEVLKALVAENAGNLRTTAYEEFKLQADMAEASSVESDGLSELQIFGRHNLQNMSAAALACVEIGITREDFFAQMKSFTGASMRLQRLKKSDGLVVYRDFAHAPSKVEATVQAVRERHPDAFLVAIFELHTYSSLNAHFLPLYRNTCAGADHLICFYAPKTLEIKKMPYISPGDISDAFAHPSIEVTTSPVTLEERLRHFFALPEDTVVLLMSSGRFGNIDITTVLEHA
jgi:UDP-N-acetylmuramate: L-alanyl-gamma-D-glutamyl-meso-diaminopimelate ligase